MKLLLTTLNAKYVHSNLALKYLYAAAVEKRVPAELREFTINNDDDYIFCELIRGDYELVCFSCYVWNIERTLYLAENLKKARPETKILLGGPEVSFDVERILWEHPFVDFLIAGEGERVFSLLLEELALGERSQTEPDLRGIPGLAFRREERIRANPPAAPEAFERIPFPYHTLPCEDDKVAYYESVRGCPFRCAYCLSSVDKTIRALPMSRVRTDLSYFIYKRVKQVKFIDRTFNYDPRRCAEIMEYLVTNDNGVTNFHFEVCGDLIDETMLELLSRARPGLFQLEIGVQSTNPATLESIRRSCDFPRLAKNVERIRNFGGVHLHLDLIAGLPYEDYLTFKKSFNDVYRLRPHDLQLGFLKLLPGTPLRDMTAEYRYVFRRQAPYEVISNAFLSADGLVRLKMVENVLDLYYNRGGFEETVERAACVLWETPFDFYQDLANYYYVSGHQHRSHRKEDLYRILYAFFHWRNGKTEELEDHPGRRETIVFELLERDLKRTMNPDAVKKFEKKGWELD